MPPDADGHSMDTTHLKNRFPGRESVIDELVFKLTCQWPLLFVHGHRGTGKSSLVHELLMLSEWTVSVQDLLEGCCPKDVFTRALVDFHMPSDEPLFDLMSACACQDATSFLEKLVVSKKKKRFVIVLDSAEVLLQTDASLINCISKMHELARPHLQLTVVLISCVPFHNFLRPGVAVFRPLVVHFKSYTREQLGLILKTRQPTGFAKELFENYAEYILTMLFDVTRNVTEIAFVCDSYFDAFVEPIRKGEVQESDSSKLWRLFEPHFRQAVASIALKGKTIEDESEEMPYAMKFLLISAFLASFNSKKSDKRFFVKAQSSRKIGRRIFRQTQCLGPKGFPVERLLHVYRSLLELNCDFGSHDAGILSEKRLKLSSSEVLSLLEDLVSLKLLVRVGETGSTISSVKKWRVSDCVTFEYLSAICKSINFDLTSHLEEFVHKK